MATSTERHNLIAVIKQSGAREAARELRKYEDAVKGSVAKLGGLDIALGTVAGNLITKFGRAAVNVTVESIQMAAQFETLQSGFKGLTAGIDENVISLKTLQTATQRMVSNSDLLLAANRAVALGLPVERMNELFEVASRLGPLMGRTVTQAVDDLSLGIGRQSKMILDNLGIVISLEEAYEAFAAQIGKTAKELTIAEKKTAVFNAAMNEATAVTEKTGDAVSKTQQALFKWNAAVENTKVGIGTFLGSYVVMLDTIIEGTKLTDEQKLANEDLIISYDALTGETVFASTAMQNLLEDTRLLSDEFSAALPMGVQMSQSALEDLARSARRVTNVVIANAVAVGTMWDVAEQRSQELASSFITVEDRLKDLFDTFIGFEVPREPLEEIVADPTELERSLSQLEETLNSTQDETDLLRLEQLQLADAFADGRITEEQYEAATDSLAGKLRDLRILQQQLRIDINNTTKAIEDQVTAVDLIAGTGLEELAPPEFTFDIPVQDPLAVGATGGGGTFQVLAQAGRRAPARTISVTIQVSAEALAGMNREEIQALARLLAEEYVRDLQARGLTP